MPSRVAHDINNALAIVVGNLELIFSNPEGRERTLRLARRALDAAELAAGHTRRLLNSPRGPSLRPRALNPNQLLLDLEEQIWDLADQAASFEMILDPELGSTLADVARFELAILDLVANATETISSCPEGRMEIETHNAVLDEAEARARTSSQGAVYVVVAIRDTGSCTTRQGKRGLGRVEAFAQESGGHLQVRSRPDQGTEVELWLPACPTAAPATISTETSSPVQPAPRDAVLLVVDDDLEVLEVVHANLADMGYRVIAARNGRDALGHLQSSQQIDLLFSDVVMPGTNGIQLAAEARRLRPGIKILLTSGYAGNVLLANKGLGEDMPPLLAKPYPREQLARIITAMLSNTVPDLRGL